MEVLLTFMHPFVNRFHLSFTTVYDSQEKSSVCIFPVAPSGNKTLPHLTKASGIASSVGFSLFS